MFGGFDCCERDELRTSDRRVIVVFVWPKQADAVKLISHLFVKQLEGYFEEKKSVLGTVLVNDISNSCLLMTLLRKYELLNIEQLV